MKQDIFLRASDGHELAAYHVTPISQQIGQLVVLHEFFGLNDHIRNVANRFAALGYEVIVPGLFDRVQRGADFDYDPVGIEAGRAMRAAVNVEDSLRDMKAGVDFISPRGKVGAIGYCWGGTLAFLAATRLADQVACSVGYYGSQIVDFLDEEIGAPLLLNFGDNDLSIPLRDVVRIRERYPQLPIHVYPGKHGFNCDLRANYTPDSAQAALSRTLAFFGKHLHGENTKVA
jgi:carboxymethylenebutenolidase